MPLFQQATFLTTVAHLRDLPPDSVREVAFAGRSNAGKSSAINTLVGHVRLAFVSKTPGRTQLINFFRLNSGALLVDLLQLAVNRTDIDVKCRFAKRTRIP